MNKGVYLAQPYYLKNTNRYKLGMTENFDNRCKKYGGKKSMLLKYYCNNALLIEILLKEYIFNNMITAGDEYFDFNGDLNELKNYFNKVMNSLNVIYRFIHKYNGKIRYNYTILYDNYNLFSESITDEILKENKIKILEKEIQRLKKVVNKKDKMNILHKTIINEDLEKNQLKKLIKKDDNKSELNNEDIKYDINFKNNYEKYYLNFKNNYKEQNNNLLIKKNYTCLRCGLNCNNKLSNLEKHFNRKKICKPINNFYFEYQFLLNVLNDNRYIEFYNSLLNKKQCPYCLKIISKTNLKRHILNCKYNL